MQEQTRVKRVLCCEPKDFSVTSVFQFELQWLLFLGLGQLSSSVCISVSSSHLRNGDNAILPNAQETEAVFSVMERH